MAKGIVVNTRANAAAVYTGTPNKFTAVTAPATKPPLHTSYLAAIATASAAREARNAAGLARAAAAQAGLATRAAAQAARPTIGRGDASVDLVASGAFVRPTKRVDVMAPPATAAQLAYANAPTDSWMKKCLPPGKLVNKNGWMQCTTSASMPFVGHKTVAAAPVSRPMIQPPERMAARARVGLTATPKTEATLATPTRLNGLGGFLRGIGDVVTGIIPGTLDDRLWGAAQGAFSGAPPAATGFVPPVSLAGRGGGCPPGVNCGPTQNMGLQYDPTPGAMTPAEQSMNPGATGFTVPYNQPINRMTCSPGHVLWKNEWTGMVVCGPKGVGAKFGLKRLHKPATRPLGTGGEMNAVRKAGQFAARLHKTEKTLKKVGRSLSR